MNIITEEMKYRQRLCEYAKKTILMKKYVLELEK